MIDPREFIKTIYLGDRSCKGICIRSWDKRVEIQVDCISRVRSRSGQWEYYSAEDIEEGKIVFAGVDYLRIEPSGLFPNDAIDHFSVIGSRSDGRFEFEFAAEAVGSEGQSSMVKILIVARSIALEDPAQPGTIIDC